MDFPINGGTYPWIVLIHRYERFNHGREWGVSARLALTNFRSRLTAPRRSQFKIITSRTS